MAHSNVDTSYLFRMLSCIFSSMSNLLSYAFMVATAPQQHFRPKRRRPREGRRWGRARPRDPFKTWKHDALASM